MIREDKLWRRRIVNHIRLFHVQVLSTGIPDIGESFIAQCKEWVANDLTRKKLEIADVGIPETPTPLELANIGNGETPPP